MSTFSSANITDGNLMLKERTHRIKIKYSMHQYSIRLHNWGNWLIVVVLLPCSRCCHVKRRVRSVAWVTSTTSGPVTSVMMKTGRSGWWSVVSATNSLTRHACLVPVRTSHTPACWMRTSHPAGTVHAVVNKVFRDKTGWASIVFLQRIQL